MNKHTWTDWTLVMTAQNTLQMVRQSPKGAVCLTVSLRQADSADEIMSGAPEPVWVVEQIQAGRDLAEYLSQDLFGTPVAKLFNGTLLDEPEYHAMRAMGILPDFATLAGVKYGSEYQVYCLLRYEPISGGPAGIIHPSVFRCSCGGCRNLPFEFNPVVPERVSRSRLSPQQEVFFREHLPEDYKQMQP